MKVLLTGGTGFIGQRLLRDLLLAGHAVNGLTRDPERAAQRIPEPVQWFGWQTDGPPPPEALAGVEAVVNLIGESIADGRWTAARKARLRASRIDATRYLAQALRALRQPPRIFVSASAVGIYGDRGDDAVDETAPAGTDFLATLCRDWEAATGPLPPETRVVHLRTAPVLGPEGGMLAKLLPIFRWGLGGRLGSGRQWMSWIHADDYVALVRFALERDDLRGPVNAVAPEPVRNADFTRALARALRRPAPFPVPGFALRLALGELAGTLLGGQRVVPATLQAAGFRFRHPALEPALAEICAPIAAGESVFEAAQWLPEPPEALFPFFLDAANLGELTPRWLGFRLLNVSTPEIEPGTLIDYRLRIHGLTVRWQTRIETLEPPHGFTDTQLRGPYALWHHTHRFEPMAGGTLAADRVRYRLPLGPLGRLLGGPLVRRDIRNIFAYRQEQLALRFGAPPDPVEGESNA